MAIRKLWIVLSATGTLATAVLAATFGHHLWETKSAHPEEKANAAAAATEFTASGKPAKSDQGPIFFTNMAQSWGIDFVAVSGRTDERHYPTANGSGVAMLDYDGDGYMDLYFLTGCFLGDAESAERPLNRLYRNVGGQRFEDMSPPSGLALAGYSQGVGVGDSNNDGFPDIYLTRYGRNVFLVNNGDGTFSDASQASGLDDPRWGTSCAFIDFDLDGDLDLYVANYGKWSVQSNVLCQDRGILLYCSPKTIQPEAHALYRNNGDGTFTDVAQSTGVTRPASTDRPLGRGQGVVAADVNQDGLPDLYVANDMSPNFLFLNRGDGSFRDVSEPSGAAFNAVGDAEAGMGVDAGDVDGDGMPDLFVTNFYMEHNTLYFNIGQGFFEDRSMASGLGAASLTRVGWGTALEDLDSDGWLDVFVTNGHVDDNRDVLDPGQSFEEFPQVWRNKGRGKFEDCSETAGAYFRAPTVGRGAAFGDLDNDGDVDIVVNHCDRQPAVLINVSRDHQGPGTRNQTITFKLVGTVSNRDAVGTEVVLTAGGRTIVRQIKGGKSYLSAHDLRLHIGLGKVEKVESVRVRWPSGIVSLRSGLEPGREYYLVESGSAADDAKP
ncbi:MAG: CRTAC1 family protein [Planctomycetes bacterium]|nr:CRTAC1 family protein [Planctomycetota bacterium]